MNTPDWVQDAIFYQIFPDRFARSQRMPDLGFESWESPPTYHGFKGGDLYGVAEKLDYLKDLGINAIYFNPIFASASNHRYHTYDYYNVDPLLGGNEAFRFLLDEAHKQKIRIVLDGVFNHASRGFWQFHHVLENGNGSPYVDWFHFDIERLQGRRRWGVYPDTGQLHALQNGEGSLKAIGYQAWWDLPALPKFNTNAPVVREFLFDVAEHWIKFGIDGWRLDVPAEINDDSFWQEFRQRVRAINPEAYIVGEIWHEAQRWLQGDQFDAVMNYLVTAALISFCGGSRVIMDIVRQAGELGNRVHPDMDANRFANEIDRLTYMYGPEITRSQLNLFDSHDMPRFLTCVGEDVNTLKLALLFMFSYVGAPCIYYGDEVGLNGGHDPDCRKGFPWDQSAWDHDLLNFTKTMISLRMEHLALRRGTFHRLYSTDGIYSFGRKLNGEALVIVMNVNETVKNIEFSVGTLDVENRPAEKIFGAGGNFQRHGEMLQLEVPPRGGSIIKL